MRQSRLSLEALETREVPAQFGIPWANPTAVTVSFAPDGTNVDGTSSQLSALMARSGLSASVWQGQILKAFQAWVSRADLNVGVVADDGSAIGTSGYQQADARFGDIRIFAVPLSSSVLAITTPPGDLAGTRTGDIILNSNYNFGIGSPAERDLYTVLLQEAGHAFGIANSSKTTSAMYEFYQGVRTGLSADDIDQIRQLYGARPAHTWEPSSGNNTRAVATPLATSGTPVTYGDIASAADPDWYSFTASANGTAIVQLRVSGLSLLAARLVVMTPGGTVVGVAKAIGPGQDLSLSLTKLTTGGKYFIRVDEMSGTPFGAGQYRLRVDRGDGTPDVVTLAGEPPVDDPGTNESFLTATSLQNSDPNGGTSYATFAHLRVGDVDVYRVHSPLPGLNQSNVLTATIRAFSDLSPQIKILNALGLPVSAQVTADGNGLYTVVATNVLPNVDCFVVVQSRTGLAGDYEMHAAFRSRVTSAHQVESGLLTFLNPKKVGTLEVIGSAEIYFQLTSALTPIIGPSVVLRVYDAANHLRFQLLAHAGDSVDGVALLGEGEYRIEISANGGLLPNLLSAYTLSLALLTDPTGVTPSDPNNPGSGGGSSDPPSGYNYYNDRGYYVWGERTPSGSG